MTTNLETSVTKAAGITAGNPIAGAIRERSEIFAQTATAEGAVLRPRRPGRLTHDLRAALAARIATANGEAAEAQRYAADVQDAALKALAVPGTLSPDPWVQAIVAFTDKVATSPRDIVADDVQALKAAGVEDADIVRAAELNAFLAYQLRLIAGLRLLGGIRK
ncbi:hypothetical protein [Neotabrizicola sp. sgz301269]|uniref:hypothetical protein n=1 Tax=Neotabrizicola sp. sgz301269 TaxID=3276282 RepID=UPI00377047C4